MSLSWQAQLLPGLSLKQAIVHVPMNHPKHIQKHKGVVSCELRGAKGKTGVSGTGCASGEEQDGYLWRPCLCRGLYQCTDQLHGALRISAVILTTGQHAAAFSYAPCGGSGKDGWQDPHSCLMPPPVCLCTPSVALCCPLKKYLCS